MAVRPLTVAPSDALVDLASSLERVADLIAAGALHDIEPLPVADDPGVAAVAAAAERLIGAVRRAHALEAAVHELFESLSAHLRLDYLGYEALYRVVEHTGASGGAIVLTGERGADLVAAADFDLEPDELEALATEAAGAPWPAQLGVAEDRGPVAAVSFSGDGGVRGAVLLAGVVIDDEIGRLLALLGRALGFAVSNALAHAAAEEQAATDPLTGCHNRRAGWAALEQAVRVAAHGGPPVSVLMVDLDHFKSINDVHGHQAGDDVLRAAGAAITHAVRDGDVVMRYGGEEFCVLVRCTDETTLARVGERIRGHVAAIAVPAAAATVRVTTSVGAAAWCAGEPVDAVIARADAALYAAKVAGRDRVVVELGPTA